MTNELIDFLRGGTMVALLGSAVFFLRYWKATKDRLFAFFSSGFFLMALSQVGVFTFGADGDKLPYAYWLRLAAFVLIFLGIVEKNLPHTKGDRHK